MARKSESWDLLEKEYSKTQVRILKRVAKRGLRGATYVPSAEGADPRPARRYRGVGPRQVRWWDNPAGCTHSGEDVCPGCSELTAEEAAAVREYVERLRAAGGVPHA